MRKTVVFLGAGASKALGLPVTKEILPLLLERLTPETGGGKLLFGGDHTHRHALMNYLSAILPGLSSAAIRDFAVRYSAADPEDRAKLGDSLPLITEVVSSADYLLLSKNAFTDLARGHLLLERALFELLVRNESPPVLQMEGVPDVVLNEWQKTSKIEFLAQRPSDYERERERMTDWLLKLASRPGDQVTLISTNYDTEIEQALYVRLGYEVFDRVDFGMSVRDPLTGKVCRRPENVRLGVYKLHGSFNLLRCDLCDNAYVHVITAIAYLTYLFEDEARSVKKKHPWLEQLLHSGAHQCHCGYPLLRHMIVAPSFVRDVRDPNLLEIWHNALEALRQADEWIIVGYSLPPEDVAIRSILLRAYQGRDTGRPPQITVVQKAETEPELTRYRLLIPGHKYVAGGFSGYLDSLDRSSP